MGNTKACPRCDTPMTQRYTSTGAKRGWNCAPCALARATAYRLAEPERVLDSKLWSFYRIRLADLRRMFAEQGGRCKACRMAGEPGTGIAGTGLVLDHDHTCCPPTDSRWGENGHGQRICGKCIRGLICPQCNVALGMVNDSIPRLLALVDYLRPIHGDSIPSAPPPPAVLHA